MSATLARRARRAAAGALCAIAFALPLQTLGAAEAQTTAQGPARATSFTSLKLLNGWTNTPDSTAHPSVRTIAGVVYFKGAMSTSGSNAHAFTLPKAFRPPVNVFVPVDMCNATKGRLNIFPSGVVDVMGEGTFSNAQCLTSLDGVSFALSGKSFTTLKLRNGWTGAADGTARAGVRLINGIVHLRGAIATSGGSVAAFTLPKAFRPGKVTYVPADLCNARNGRLFILPSGLVQVEAENSFADAQCFTSLDGVSFAKSGNSFTSLTLKNGWTNTTFQTAHASARVISGIVHLRGAISTNGNNATPFILPKAFRPATSVFVPVDLCLSHNGRLLIRPNGVVFVHVEKAFSDAQCFTSLDGAWFAR